MERWKWIKEHPDYDVSDKGEVISWKRKEFISMKKVINGGRYVVCLDNEAVKVHRLVAEAFVPNPNGYRNVCHKNGDLLDNRVENLYWTDAPKLGKKHTAEGKKNMSRAARARWARKKEVKHGIENNTEQ